MALHGPCTSCSPVSRKSHTAVGEFGTVLRMIRCHTVAAHRNLDEAAYSASDERHASVRSLQDAAVAIGDETHGAPLCCPQAWLTPATGQSAAGPAAPGP